MSTITTTPDPLRAQLHAMWSGVAGAWAVHLAYIDARGQHITDACWSCHGRGRASASSSWRAAPAARGSTPHRSSRPGARS